MGNISTNGTITAPFFNGEATGYAKHQSATSPWSTAGWYTVAKISKNGKPAVSSTVLVTLSNSYYYYPGESLTFLICGSEYGNGISIKILNQDQSITSNYIFSAARVIQEVEFGSEYFYIQVYYNHSYINDVFANVFILSGYPLSVASMPMNNTTSTGSIVKAKIEVSDFINGTFLCGSGDPPSCNQKNTIYFKTI